MVLRGIFLLRHREIEWYYQEGASRMFPEAWEKYLEPIPLDERDDMVGAYYRRLTSRDRNERIPSRSRVEHVGRQHEPAGPGSRR